MKIRNKNRLAALGYCASCGYLAARHLLDKPLGLSDYFSNLGVGEVIHYADKIMPAVAAATLLYLGYRLHRAYRKISESPDKTRTYYEQLDGFLTSMSVFPWYRGKIIKNLLENIDSRHKTLVSLGGGSGRIEREIAKSGIDIVNIDTSSQDLRKCKIQDPSMECIVADAESLPLRRDSIDVVFSNESIGHLHPLSTFAESKRVLRKGGIIQVSTYSDCLLNLALFHPRQYNLYSSGNLAKAAENMGFDQIRAKEFLTTPLFIPVPIKVALLTASK